MVPTPPQTSHKAWVAAVTAALMSLIATLQGRPELETMTWVDWFIVVASAIVAGLTVWTVPNKVKEPGFDDEAGRHL
jgi:hypothetical protein